MRGIERAVFGDVAQAAVDAWLAEHVRERLSATVEAVLFRSGRLAAVYGLRLHGGTEIVAKVHRGSADVGRLAAATACRHVLADAAYPCPRPLDDPVHVGGRVVTLETRLDHGERGDAHRPETRRAMAEALVRQVEILRVVPAAGSALAHPPAWAAYEAGPWPTPHDPMFDFSVTPGEFAWLDRLAARATHALGPRREPDAIAHADWVCQNLRFAGAAVTTAYDWDSLLAHSEPVLAGLSAGAYTEGSTVGPVAPTPDEVAAFLADYDAARATPFGARQQGVAAAAATWVLAYNARCGVGAAIADRDPRSGTPLELASRYGDRYLTVRW